MNIKPCLGWVAWGYGEIIIYVMISLWTNIGYYNKKRVPAGTLI